MYSDLKREIAFDRLIILTSLFRPIRTEKDPSVLVHVHFPALGTGCTYFLQAVIDLL